MKMIDPLAWRVWSYARKWNMLDGLVLCAVSGGRDSMVMLRLLSALGAEGGFHIAAAHFNHRLRTGTRPLSGTGAGNRAFP